MTPREAFGPVRIAITDEPHGVTGITVPCCRLMAGDTLIALIPNFCPLTGRALPFEEIAAVLSAAPDVLSRIEEIEVPT